MSKIHVLTSDGVGRYQIVLHTPTPLGNNSANVSWKVAGVNSGLFKSTIMTEGNGAGQIITSEKSQVTSGDVIEISAKIMVESSGASQSSLEEMANQIITETLNRLSKQLKYFGYIQ